MTDVLLRSSSDYSEIITDTRTLLIPTPLDEVMDKGGCIAVEDHESSLKDIFGANLSNEEILQKALQTIHRAKKRGGITLREIQSRWKESELSEGTNPRAYYL